MFDYRYTDDEIDTLADLRKHQRHTTPRHDNPADFGLTQADADKLRLRYLLAKRKEYQEQVDIFHRFSVDPHIRSDQMWFILWQYNYWYNKVKEIQRKIDFVKSQKNKTQLPQNTFDLDALKQIPIENFVEVHPHNSSFKLREERTPSCHLYRAQNRFHDFGTGEGGSVIDLIMILRDCTFVEACKYLSNSE